MVNHTLLNYLLFDSANNNNNSRIVTYGFNLMLKCSKRIQIPAINMDGRMNMILKLKHKNNEAQVKVLLSR